MDTLTVKDRKAALITPNDYDQTLDIQRKLTQCDNRVSSKDLSKLRAIRKFRASKPTQPLNRSTLTKGKVTVLAEVGGYSRATDKWDAKTLNDQSRFTAESVSTGTMGAGDVVLGFQDTKTATGYLYPPKSGRKFPTVTSTPQTEPDKYKLQVKLVIGSSGRT